MKRLAVAVLLAAVCALLLLTAAEYTKMRREYKGIRIGNSEAVAGKIRTGLRHRAWKLHITFRSHTKDDRDIKRIMDELLEQALQESDDPCGGDYIRCQLGGYRMHYDLKRSFLGYQCHMELMPTYYSTREQEDYVDVQVERILTNLAQKAEAGSDQSVQGRGARSGTEDRSETAGGTAYRSDAAGGTAEGAAEDAASAISRLSEEQKIRLVHDYVTELLSYDSVHKDKENSHGKVTAYAALRYHQVVCQGYAVLTYRLLKEMGVHCRIETGDALIDGRKERHAWLRVIVGGRELYMDPTLDDVNSCYDWFLKTADEFGKDHVIVRDPHSPEG